MPKKKATSIPRPTKKKSVETKVLLPGKNREQRGLIAKIAKLQGQSITRQEQRDLSWVETTTAAQTIAQWIAAVPKGEYCKLAGRQHKLVDDAARLYELPIADATIDLADAITALHDLVAANAARIRNTDFDGDRDELEDEKLRQQIAKLRSENDLLKVRYADAARDSIPRSELIAGLEAVSPRMREFGADFGRISDDARDLYNDVCDTLAEEVENGRLKFG